MVFPFAATGALATFSPYNNEVNTTALDEFHSKDSSTDHKDVAHTAGPVLCCPESDDSTESEDNVEDTIASQWPEMWSTNQIAYFKEANQWLTAQNGLLGCRVYYHVITIELNKAHRLNLSPEWSEVTVSYNGNTREQHSTSLRKKDSCM